MNVLRSFITTLFVTAFAVAAFTVTAVLADEWTSPDGAIVVTAPDDADFEHVTDPPEPFVALWLSKDETARFGVMKMAIPSNVKLNRSSTEEGLAEEVGGTVTASSSTVKNGHEIWIMTAKGSTQGTNLRITQALVQYSGSLYKVMAAVVGDGAMDDATISAFVNSIEMTQPHVNSETAPIPNRDQRSGDGIDLHNLSKTIGGAGALLLIVLIVWLVARRGKPKP